jgi:hypothetical protein
VLPEYVPPAAPGDITLDPVPAPTLKARQGLLIGAGVVVLAAIVTLVVALTSKSPPRGQQQPSAPPLPSFRSYEEPLGFSIQVPADWTRTESTQDAQSDVLWVGPPRDPRAGAPQVQVRRDTTGTTAQAYLAAEDKSESSDRENADYQQIAVSGDELEYVHGSAVGDLRFHVLAKAVVDKQGRLFVLTFSLHASDPARLQTEWQAAEPVFAKIRDSFRLSS